MKIGWRGVVVIGLFGVLAVWYVKRQATAIVEAVNPVSPDNVINQGVEAIGTAVSGEQGWTLGGWLYDITHPGTMSAEAIRSTPPADATSPGLPGGG